MQGSEVWISQPNEAGRALARAHAHAQRARREGAPNLSGNLRTAVEPEPPAAGAGRRCGDPESGLSLIVFPIKEPRRLEQ